MVALSCGRSKIEADSSASFASTWISAASTRNTASNLGHGTSCSRSSRLLWRRNAGLLALASTHGA